MRIAGLAAVGVAAYWGGWEWAALCVLMLAVVWRADGEHRVPAAAGGSLIWLALFCWSGDRRLFFPYAMQFAAQAAYLTRGRVAPGAIIGAFLLIRVWQAATIGVLAFEFVTAVVIAAFVERIYALSGEGKWVRATAAAIGSTLAFASLAFN